MVGADVEFAAGIRPRDGMRHACGMQLDTVIFDIGQVVVTWEPERAFEAVMPASDVPAFMARIGFAEFNRANDGRASIVGSEDDLVARHPSEEVGIRAYRANFPLTIQHSVPGTGAIIAELARAGHTVSALTNWSADMFAIARERFQVLGRFRDIVVSGVEGIVKPDPEIYRLACRRLGIDPSRAVFVDDTLANAVAASDVGLVGLQFTGAATLRADLVRLGLLGEPEPVPGPVYHWALREDWERAALDGYPWSTRGVEYERAGFVHCSLASQVDGIRDALLGDLPRENLVLLELDPAGLPIVLEDGGDGKEYPHLFAPLPVGLAQSVDSPAQASQ